MWMGGGNSAVPGRGRQRAGLGGAGIALVGAFLWLAMRDIDPAVVASTLRQVNGYWLVVSVILERLSKE